MGNGPNGPARALVQRLDRRPDATRTSPYAFEPSADSAVRTGFEWTHLLGFSLGGAEHVAVAAGKRALQVPKLGEKDSIPGLEAEKITHTEKVFGGKAKLPKTNPQLARNLVLGTYTVNSHMLQAEIFLAARVQAEQGSVDEKRERYEAAARMNDGVSAVDAHPDFKLTLMAKVAPLLMKQRGSDDEDDDDDVDDEPTPFGRQSQAVIMQLPPTSEPDARIKMKGLVTDTRPALPAATNPYPHRSVEQQDADEVRSWPTW